VGVFCVLSQDALDLTGVIGSFVADNLHRKWEIGLDGGKRPPMSEAHAHVASGGSYGGIGTSTPRSLMLETKSLSRATVAMTTRASLASARHHPGRFPPAGPHTFSTVSI
jgi:hypothetical protein